jgi:hypothetical protein
MKFTLGLIYLVRISTAVLTFTVATMAKTSIKINKKICEMM